MGRKSEFSREEKITAVRLTTDGGRTVLSVANEYGVHENTIMKWKRQYKTNPDLAFSEQNGETPPDETERLILIQIINASSSHCLWVMEAMRLELQVRERTQWQRRSTTFSREVKTSLRKPFSRISSQSISMGFSTGV